MGSPKKTTPEDAAARVMAAAGAHEWVSFDDPDERRTWVFDVTFLVSGWECVYGQGCQGVLTGPAPELAQGCCSYGAHFTDDADVARVRKAARTLGPDEWQFAREGKRGGIVATEEDGTRITRLVDDACIFLNRPGFPAGPGCALHQAAVRRGVDHLGMKPDVCWQLPLRREDVTDESGRVTSTVSQWDRRHWGDGGDEFHWWCTEASEAFGGRRPVYVTLEPELRALAGDAVYDMLSAYLRRRVKGQVALPHPAVKSRRA